MAKAHRTHASKKENEGGPGANTARVGGTGMPPGAVTGVPPETSSGVDANAAIVSGAGAAPRMIMPGAPPEE
jgi:hypothetical protein